MASEKQKAGSCVNGAKARGPITPEGKLRFSRSNVEREMLARTVVFDDESRPRFDALMISLQEELKPEASIENLLIHKMAADYWRLGTKCVRPPVHPRSGPVREISRHPNPACATNENSGGKK
jgi:hypothetical protein